LCHGRGSIEGSREYAFLARGCIGIIGVRWHLFFRLLILRGTIFTSSNTSSFEYGGLDAFLNQNIELDT
jgi:hypothetical protein